MRSRPAPRGDDRVADARQTLAIAWAARNTSSTPGLPTTYRPNAARVAAAVLLKYSGGRMNHHSRNFTPS
jgi:anti-sigma factor RsiW